MVIEQWVEERGEDARRWNDAKTRCRVDDVHVHTLLYMAPGGGGVAFIFMFADITRY
jgi:hypothetical protein